MGPMAVAGIGSPTARGGALERVVAIELAETLAGEFAGGATGTAGGRWWM